MFGYFYWYEVRPAEIRKKCFKEAETSARNICDFKLIHPDSSFEEQFGNAIKKGTLVIKEGKDRRIRYLKDDFDSYYINCLKENGLKK